MGKSKRNKRRAGRGTTARTRQFDRSYNRVMAIGGRFSRYFNLAALAIIAAVLLILAASFTPQRRGDGNEYYLMAFSFVDHQSPDLQDEDINAFIAQRQLELDSSFTFKEDVLRGVNLSESFYPANSGEKHPVHFWLFSLFAAPALWFLGTIGVDSLMALQITSALFVIFALSVVLLYSGFGRYQKWIFAALLVSSPAVWYLDWSGPGTRMRKASCATRSG